MWERFIVSVTKYPITEASSFITFVPILIGLLYYKYLSKESKFLLSFLGIYSLFNLISTWLSLKSQNNIHLFNLSEIIEISSICIIFFQLNTQKIKRIFLVVLLIFCILIGIWKFDFFEFAYIPYVLYRISYLVIVFIYFNTLLSEIAVKNILIHPPFWLCAGLVIYSTGSILIFLFGKQVFSINAPLEIFVQFYTLVSVINIIFRLLIAVSFFVSKYEKQ